MCRSKLPGDVARDPHPGIAVSGRRNRADGDSPVATGPDRQIGRGRHHTCGARAAVGSQWRSSTAQCRRRRAAAEFASPLAIAVDESGNPYVADGTTIRKVTPAGVVTTVAGIDGEAGIRLGNLPGRLEKTRGLAIIDSNTLAVTERFTVLKMLLDDP
jgi:hypothetical protein